jgi:membrane protease YdiL (CAAX protease family)
MDAEPRAPWNPDRSWADPLIALLALLALLAAGFTLLARQKAQGRPSHRVSLQGRLAEVALEAPELLTGKVRPPDWDRAEGQLKEPWDRALVAVLKAEREPTTDPRWIEAVTPPGVSGLPFRRACLAAYGGGSLPSRAERVDLQKHLGPSYGADLLEARLRDREGGGEALRTQARQALLTHMAGLGLLGLLGLGAAASGLAVGMYLWVNRRQPPPQPLPPWSLSGRAAVLVLLIWFLGFFLSGNVAGLLLLPWPGLRWLAVPLGYTLHATLGVHLLCRAEGLSLAALWRRVAPGRAGRDLAWGAGFLALAVVLVLAVAMVSGLLLKPDHSSQRDLQELLRGLTGWGPSLLLFLTVAGLAPLFEELLCRGFLLPVLARRQPLALALLLSALAFGAMHLQPGGLPVLSTLGLVLGLAMRHTGSLRTPVLVHACWNGTLFLLMRSFA